MDREIILNSISIEKRIARVVHRGDPADDDIVYDTVNINATG